MEYVGKYRLVNELGRGATSRVVRAYDEFDQRWVALKMVEANGSADSEMDRLNRRMFVNEASLVGKLSHPHIVQIYDAAEVDGVSYIAMECVTGGALSRHCAPAARLPWQSIFEIGLRCARALHFAAGLGVIHRDIKPDNLLLRSGFDVAVSDFGAAMISDGRRTQIGEIGTPSYMSPQQLKGNPPNVQSDIYSLGVVLYRLLTGKLPFNGATAESLAYEIAWMDPQPPHLVDATVPPAAGAVVMRMLAKDTEERYRNWDELSLDLADVLVNDGEREGSLSTPRKLELIGRAPLFREFSDAHLWEVLRVAQWHGFAAGDKIIREGEAASSFFVLLVGQLGVTKAGRLLNGMSAGECFGEMPLADPGQMVRTASVTALTDAQCLEIPFADLAQFSTDCARRFDKAFLRLMAQRLDLLGTRLAASAS